MKYSASSTFIFVFVYAIVDIETTGGHPSANAITEISVYISDGEKVIDENGQRVN